MAAAVSGENGQRIFAAAFALLMLFLMTRLMLVLPKPSISTSEGTVTQVYFVRAEPRMPPVDGPVDTAATAETAPAMSAQRPPAAAVVDQVPAATPAQSTEHVSAPTPSSTPALAESLYTRDGRIRVRGEAVPAASPAPPGLAGAQPSEEAKKLLQRDNPIDYRPTRFDKDWASDGTLGQRAGKAIERANAAIGKAIFGEPRQEVKARPPPDVAFNPALHERASDLGSEATGDAYKAAPIAHETPPADGEASRRIRTQLAELRQRAIACGRSDSGKLLAPVSQHLKDLEQAEYALGHGADPVMAKHMLPRQLDSAYDLSRRALWYAREKLSACGK